MAAPPRQRSGGGRTTSLRGDTSESDKLESTTSWDVLEWTKIEPDSRYVSHVKFDFLLEAEQVIVEGYGVVLVNTDEAGTLIVTNFRLIFLVIKAQSAPRQSDKTPSRRLLQVIGKDMRIIVFGFRPRTKQRREVFDALLRCTKPASLWDLYAFTSGTSKFKNSNPKERLLTEYFRLLGKGSFRPSMDMIEKGSFTFSNDLWRISSINSNYAMCQSYPFALIVPKGISDEEVLQASTFRARCRLPVVSWCHPRSGAVLARSSQPLVGLMMNMRSNTDEKLVAALCTQLASVRGARRLRPRWYSSGPSSVLWSRAHRPTEDITRADVDLAVEPPVKASTGRHEALVMAVSSVTQTEMSCAPAKASVKVGGPFSDGFHVGASLATRDRADTAPFDTTRTDLVSFSPTEPLGCLAETSAEVESLFFGGLRADEPLSTLGKAETEGDRALIGLELSNYVPSPLRVGIEEGGVLGGDEGDSVEGASDIQGIDTSYQANRQCWH
nr:isoform 2 of phosphatidylinositol-3-phosphatase myotubularin-1 [Quercus suber]